MEVSNSDDDNGNGVRTWASSCLHTTVTGVVQTTLIYDQVCDLLSGNSAIVWSPRGRLWCSGWEAHQKNRCQGNAVQSEYMDQTHVLEP
jgi:hypothetical protein